MFRLHGDQVASWKHEVSTYLPAAIDLNCPDCNRAITFANFRWQSAPQNTRVAVAKCPACGKPSTFFIINHGGASGKLAEGEELYVAKKPPTRSPIAEIVDSKDLSEPLRRAYASAINVSNANEWSATAVLTRRLLEGVTKSLAPEHQSLPLAKQVAKLAESKDLSAPITTIADAIRKGGNLGAHFDLEVEPTPEVATLMLDLVEELLEYFYVLPARIQELHDQIENLSNSGT